MLLHSECMIEGKIVRLGNSTAITISKKQLAEENLKINQKVKIAILKSNKKKILNDLFGTVKNAKTFEREKDRVLWLFLVDTSVWIEILKGTTQGKTAINKITNTPIFTASISMAELSKWSYLNSKNSKEILSQIENASAGIISTTRTTELRAGNLWVTVNKHRQKKLRTIGLVDCIIAATAEENCLKILTKDKDFLAFEQIENEII